MGEPRSRGNGNTEVYNEAGWRGEQTQLKDTEAEMTVAPGDRAAAIIRGVRPRRGCGRGAVIAGPGGKEWTRGA